MADVIADLGLGGASTSPPASAGPAPGRGLLAFLLGGWFFATVVVGFVAWSTFHVLKPATLPRAAEVYGALGDGEAQRQALRFAASEVNRFLFARYHHAQVVLGALALGAAAFARAPRKALAAVAAALAIAAVSALWLTPELVALGRQIDFVPRDPLPPEVRRFGVLHGAVEGLELVKLILLVLAARWAARAGRAAG